MTLLRSQHLGLGRGGQPRARSQNAQPVNELDGHVFREGSHILSNSAPLDCRFRAFHRGKFWATGVNTPDLALPTAEVKAVGSRRRQTNKISCNYMPLKSDVA